MKAILCAIGMRAGRARSISATGNFIEKSGLCKQRVLVLMQVNCDGSAHMALGGEVMTLANAIQTSVYERFGLRLEPVVV